MINNVKEFIDYNDNKCYYCNEELRIEPQIFGNVTAKFLYEEDKLIVTSRYVNLSVDLINNTVETPNTNPGDIDILLSRQRLYLIKVCKSISNYHNYSMRATFAFDPNYMKVLPISLFEEDMILYHQYRLITNHVDKSCELGFSATSSGLGSRGFNHQNMQNIPYIDTSKINQDQLKEKLNLYRILI